MGTGRPATRAHFRATTDADMWVQIAHEDAVARRHRELENVRHLSALRGLRFDGLTAVPIKRVRSRLVALESVEGTRQNRLRPYSKNMPGSR